MVTQIETVAPREQVGAKTGAAYEFQYAEAALACLELLQEGDASCVYCEWHDDYVLERESSGPRYEFFQVKSRSQTRGVWTMTSILGVKRARSRMVESESEKDGSKRKPRHGRTRPLEPTKELGIAELLLDHQRRFRGACAAFAVVTNGEVKEDELFHLLEDAKNLKAEGKGLDALEGDSRAVFDELLAAYGRRDSEINADDLWALVSRLRIHRAQGRYGELSVAIGLMGQRIYDLAEVNLRVTDQRRIANQLLDAVRAKSHRVLDGSDLPGASEVRRMKAVTADEVLRFLPLSRSGYRTLKEGGRSSLKELSRLHRLCEESRMDPQLIELVCTMRIRWEEWRARHRDTLTDSTLALMTERALKMLQVLRQGGDDSPFSKLKFEAESLADELSMRQDIPELAAEDIAGLVFAIAASEE